MSHFRLRFACKGDRSIKKDANGDEIVQLRTIEDMYHDPQQDCRVFGVTWWEREGSQDWVHPVKVSQLKKDYPLQVKEWEETYGEKWELANLDEEKLWFPDFDDPSEHQPRSKKKGVVNTARGTSAKRQHQDTPNKARQDPTKKLKAVGNAADEEEEVNVPEDDEEMDSDDIPLLKKTRDIFDLPSDDSPEKLPLSRGTKTFRFQLSKPQSPGKNKFQRLVKSSAPVRPRQPARRPTKARAGASSSSHRASQDIDSSERDEDLEESSDDQTLPKLKGQASPDPLAKSGKAGSLPVTVQAGFNKTPPRKMGGHKITASRGLGSPGPKGRGVSGHQMTLTSRPAPSSSPIKIQQKVHFQMDEESDDEESSNTPSPDDTPRKYGMPGRETQLSEDEDEEDDIGTPESPENDGGHHRHPEAGSEDDDGLPLAQQSSPTANQSTLHGHPSPEAEEDVLDDEAQLRSQLQSPDQGHLIFGDGQEAAEIAFAETQIEQEGIDLDEEPPVQQTQIRADGEDSVYNRYSELLINSLDQGIDSLVMTAMNLTGMPCDGWVVKRKASKLCQYRDLLHSLWIMIISWEPLVLRHVVHGNLPEEENRNPELKKALRAMNENLPKTKVCPSTYINYLVDKDGKATTADDFKLILDICELYLGGLDKPEDDSGSHELAAKVDSALPSKVWGSLRCAKEGKRRYIESRTQADKCMEWIEASRERLRGLPDDEPLARPLCEVGFAKTPHERLAQHATHTSSNYLMNLAEAACMTNTYLTKYRIKQYVVHHLAHYTHAMYDEILASRFALVYTSQGGGFSHYPAGISHKGAEKTEKEHYNAQQQLLARDSNFGKRAAAQIEKMKDIAKFYDEFVEVTKQYDETIERVALAAKALDDKVEEVVRQQKREKKAWATLTDPILDFMDFAEELEEELEDLEEDWEVEGI